MWMTLSNLIGGGLLLLGTGFCILGIYGVLRLPDVYDRLHAGGMVITLGACSVLLALLFLAETRAGIKALATAAFLLLTAPMVTHLLSRTAYNQGVPLPPEAIRDDLAEDRKGESVE